MHNNFFYANGLKITSTLYFNQTSLQIVTKVNIKHTQLIVQLCAVHIKTYLMKSEMKGRYTLRRLKKFPRIAQNLSILL